jgi:hypothetical protein
MRGPAAADCPLSVTFAVAHRWPAVRFDLSDPSFSSTRHRGFQGGTRVCTCANPVPSTRRASGRLRCHGAQPTGTEFARRWRARRRLVAAAAGASRPHGRGGVPTLLFGNMGVAKTGLGTAKDRGKRGGVLSCGSAFSGRIAASPAAAAPRGRGIGTLFARRLRHGTRVFPARRTSEPERGRAEPQHGRRRTRGQRWTFSSRTVTLKGIFAAAYARSERASAKGLESSHLTLF